MNLRRMIRRALENITNGYDRMVTIRSELYAAGSPVPPQLDVAIDRAQAAITAINSARELLIVAGLLPDDPDP
jgi:hypothetical protein